MSLFSPRASHRVLAGLCRRVGASLEAGLEVRRVWEREAEAARSPALRRRLNSVSQAVALGSSVADAVEETGVYFPLMFREMAAVGEETGKLDEVFRHLAEHYDRQISMRRTFLLAVTWPLLKLSAAVFVIGLLIWVMGFVSRLTGGEPIDILGFGLVGNSGLAIYIGLVAGVVSLAGLAYYGLRRGWFWSMAIERIAMRIPLLGSNLQTLAIARFAWALNLTLETAMPLERALPLALRSTQRGRFTRHTADVVRAVKRGDEISDALWDTAAFPPDFIEAMRVGEASGRLPESMAILSKQYQERAWAALAAMSLASSFAVGGLIALVLIALIFRLFSFYLNTIYDVASW